MDKGTGAMAKILGRLRSGSGLGVFLDVDGTLSPIVARPEDARLEPGAREALTALVPRVALVAVISGRPTPEAARLVGVDGITVFGSYGLEDLPDISAAVLAAVDIVASGFSGVRVERKGGTVAVHVRGTGDPDAVEADLERTLTPIARKAQMEIAHGKRVLELVPAGRDLKGEVLERTIGDRSLDAVMFAGDDVADLGAFAALDRAAARGIVTVRVAVRGPETPDALVLAADLVVEGPEGVVQLLRLLVD